MSSPIETCLDQLENILHAAGKVNRGDTSRTVRLARKELEALRARPESDGSIHLGTYPEGEPRRWRVAGGKVETTLCDEWCDEWRDEWAESISFREGNQHLRAWVAKQLLAHVGLSAEPPEDVGIIDLGFCLPRGLCYRLRGRTLEFHVGSIWAKSHAIKNNDEILKAWVAKRLLDIGVTAPFAE